MVKRGLSERQEAIFRIIVLFVSGILLYVWFILIELLVLVHWIITLVSGRRNKDMAELSEYWNTEIYKFFRYITFVTNSRPWPFSKLERFTKFSKK